MIYADKHKSLMYVKAVLHITQVYHSVTSHHGWWCHSSSRKPTWSS